MYPKISIIVPVYNAEKYLPQCIDSILNQELKEIEVILVNDGSIDKSGDICDKYSQKDNRVRVIHTENQGVSSARNKGLKIAVGEYITFVDADDWVDSDIYIDALKLIDKTGSDICISSHFIFDGEKKHYKVLPWNTGTVFEREDIINKLIPSLLCPIGINGEKQTMVFGAVWKCVIKKELLVNNNIYFDTRLKYTEDLVFLLNTIIKAKRVTFNNKAVYYYRVDKKNPTGTTQRYVKNAYNNLKLSQQLIYKSLIEDENLKKLSYCLEVRNCSNLLLNIYNICAPGNPYNLRQKIQIANYIMDDSKFKYSINKIGYYPFRFHQKILFLLSKYNLISFVVIIYSIRSKLRELISRGDN